MNKNYSAAEDAFNERIAICREGNRIPDTAPTPPEIIAIAQSQAEQVWFEERKEGK